MRHQSIERGDTLGRTAGLVQETRVAIPRANIHLHECLRHAALCIRDLTLPASGLVLLTAFKGSDRFPVQILFAIEGPDAGAILIAAPLVSHPHRHPAQDLRDGRLRDAELRGDLPLRAARGLELPRAVGARGDDGERFMAAYAATMDAPAGCHPAASPLATCRTVPPV